MKSLSQYIIEALQQVRLSEVDVTYDIYKGKNILVEAPESWQESDIQAYLDDIWLMNFPSGADYSEKFFQKNCANIFDVYIQYDKYEHLAEYSPNYDDIKIDWDENYKGKKVNPAEKMNYFKLSKVQYIIKFDRFDINVKSDDQIQSVLNEIFNTTVSNILNKYPVELSLDNKNITFQKMKGLTQFLKESYNQKEVKTFTEALRLITKDPTYKVVVHIDNNDEHYELSIQYTTKPHVTYDFWLDHAYDDTKYADNDYEIIGKERDSLMANDYDAIDWKKMAEDVSNWIDDDLGMKLNANDSKRYLIDKAV